MGKLFYLKVGEAYAKSKAIEGTSELADRLWEYKHPGEPIDFKDREYISWVNSLPVFLNCVHEAGLDEVYAIFEMKTPISNKAIDHGPAENRILIVELKQWNSISTDYKAGIRSIQCKHPVDFDVADYYQKLVRISSWTKADFEKETKIKDLCKQEGIEPDYTIGRYTVILEKINRIERSCVSRQSIYQD